MTAIMGMLGKVGVGLIGQALSNKITRKKTLVLSDAKGLAQSKTAQGVALLAFGPIIAGWFGIDEAIVTETIRWLGAGWAIYGRIKAEKIIGG